MGSCQSNSVIEGPKVLPKPPSPKHSKIKNIEKLNISEVKNINISDIKNKKYKKKNIPKAVKRAVWDKWVGKEIGTTKCLCCNHQEIRQIEFHCGHILAEKNGGKTNIENLRPICAQCNLSMGTMDMREFQNTYFKK